MTNETKHTPTPWVLDDDGDGDYKIISEEGHLIAVETSYYPIAHSIEDAAHIVKCVNMHDELVEALEAAANSSGFQYMFYETREKISSALAKARGEV